MHFYKIYKILQFVMVNENFITHTNKCGDYLSCVVPFYTPEIAL